MISGHYKTGISLTDDVIEKIITLKTLTSGGSVLYQVWLSFISLNYYNQGANVDTDAVREALHRKMLHHSMIDPDDHFQASFGHLTGYGSKYYGYMWSKVFALDLFGHIKKFGLLNPEIGKQYAEKVLGKGGSADPEELLIDFLGRKPNQEAFFKDLGL